MFIYLLIRSDCESQIFHRISRVSRFECKNYKIVRMRNSDKFIYFLILIVNRYFVEFREYRGLNVKIIRLLRCSSEEVFIYFLTRPDFVLNTCFRENKITKLHTIRVQFSYSKIYSLVRKEKGKGKKKRKEDTIHSLFTLHVRTIII